MRTAKEIYCEVRYSRNFVIPGVTKGFADKLRIESITDIEEINREIQSVKKDMTENCNYLYTLWHFSNYTTELVCGEEKWHDIFKYIDEDMNRSEGYDEDYNLIVLPREDVEKKWEDEFKKFLPRYYNFMTYERRRLELQAEGKRLERIRAKTDLGISWQAADEIYKILTTEFFPHSCTPYIVSDKKTWDNLCDGKPNKVKKIKLNEGRGSQQLIMDILNVIGYEYNSVMKEKLNEYFGLPNKNVSHAKSNKGESDLLLRLRNIVGKYEK